MMGAGCWVIAHDACCRAHGGEGRELARRVDEVHAETVLTRYHTFITIIYLYYS